MIPWGGPGEYMLVGSICTIPPETTKCKQASKQANKQAKKRRKQISKKASVRVGEQVGR